MALLVSRATKIDPDHQRFSFASTEAEVRDIVREQASLYGLEEERSLGWIPGEPVEVSPYYYHGRPIVRSRLSRPARPTIVELFSGCGGLSTGFAMAGFDSALGADIHIPSSLTYHANHRTAHCLLGDLKKVQGNDLLDVLDERPAVVLAGIPCQGFSLNNRKRHEEDERNYLFRELLRLLETLQPDVVIIENVTGLSSAKDGSFVRDIREGLRHAGFGNSSVKQLNAADYGVPQLRERFFIFGSRVVGDFRWPTPGYGPGTGVRFRTVGDAIADLPPLRPGQTKTEYSREPDTEYQRIMRGRQRILHNHEAPNHPPETIARIRATRQGQPMYDRFKQRVRLALDRPSPTQVSGGIRPQFQFGHPTQARGLSIRERCRIQSFPDSYEILGGIVQGRVQTGNAVPPLLAAAIGRACLEFLYS